MKNMSKRKYLASICRKITKARKAYAKGNPIMSDYQYDQLILKAQKLKPSIQLLRNIGEKPKPYESVCEKRKIPMGSLNNARGQEELYAWLAKIAAKEEIERVLVTPKIDGLSLEVVYNDHELVGAYTRGDGKVGVDVTATILQMKDIPKFVVVKGIHVVRGECFIEKSMLVKLNEVLKEKGQELYKVPRSIAVGMLKAGTAVSPHCKECYLKFAAWELARTTSKRANALTTEEQKLHFIKHNLGLPIVSTTVLERWESDYYLKREIELWETFREKIDTPLDGMVVSVNNLKLIDNLGHINYTPKGKIAFKFRPQQATTTIRKIELQVGRTGKITPVIIFDEVNLGGAIIGRATGSNFKELARKQIGVGATALIEKGGEVIPSLVKIVKEGSPPPAAPKECPVCKSKVSSLGRDVYCLHESCPCRIERRCIHFFQTLKVRGLGPATVEKLAKHITNEADIFTISQVKLSRILGERTAKNLIKERQKILEKGVPFHIFLAALGMKGVGGSIAKLLAVALKSINEITDFPAEVAEVRTRMLLETSGKFGRGGLRFIPVEVAKRAEDMQKLAKVIRIYSPALSMQKKNKGPLSGNTFYITGKLWSSRQSISDLVAKQGGTVTENMKKTNTFFIMGENGKTHKLEKAQKLGIKVINATEFYDMISGEKVLT